MFLIEFLRGQQSSTTCKISRRWYVETCLARKWSHRAGLNRRSFPYQGSALPLCYDGKNGDWRGNRTLRHFFCRESPWPFGNPVEKQVGTFYPLLYQLSYLSVNWRGERFERPTQGLNLLCCSQPLKWSAQPDLNWWHPRWKRGVLPLNYVREKKTRLRMWWPTPLYTSSIHRFICLRNGCPTRIWTLTTGSRDQCATVTQSGSE